MSSLGAAKAKARHTNGKAPVKSRRGAALLGLGERDPCDEEAHRDQRNGDADVPVWWSVLEAHVVAAGRYEDAVLGVVDSIARAARGR